jgi:hypothetical protein
VVADVLKTLDPPKSSLKRRNLTLFPHFLRGARGDLLVSDTTQKSFQTTSNTALLNQIYKI